MAKDKIYKVSLFTAMIFFVTYLISVCFMKIGGDFPVHSQSAQIIIDKGLFELLKQNPYPLWHLCVAGCCSLLRMPMMYSAAFVTACFNALCYLGVYYFLSRGFSYDGTNIPLLSFAAMIVGPLWMPWWNEMNLYWTANPWHNPTSPCVRPFAVIAFILIIGLLNDYENGKKIKISRYVILAVTMVIANIAKPSFAQVIIPGLGIYLIYLFIKTKGKSLKFSGLVILAFVPCVVITALQFGLSFFVESYGSGGIEISWMAALKHSLGNVWKLVVLHLFPILVLSINYKAFKKPEVKLLIFTWICSFIEMALLIEKGTRRYDGNFTWGFVLCTFLAYIVSIKVLLESTHDEKEGKVKNILLFAQWGLFFLQLMIGIYYAFTFIFPLFIK